MEDTENFYAYNEKVGESFLETPQDDAHSLFMKKKLLDDPADSKAGDEDGKLNDALNYERNEFLRDAMQEVFLAFRGGNYHLKILELTNSPAIPTGISKSVLIAEKSCSQDDNKPKQEHQVQIEEEASKQTERILSQQGKVQQDALSSAEDEGSTRSTINALTSRDQAAKDQDFAEGAAFLCLNSSEQGEIQILPHHVNIADGKKDENITLEKHLTCNQIYKKFFEESVFDPSLFAKKDKKRGSNLLPGSKIIYKENFMKVNETFLELINPKPKRKKRGNNKTKQEEIEIEEETDSEQVEELEIQQKKDPKNFILSIENQEFPSSSAPLVYKVTTEEENPAPAPNQQEVEDAPRNEKLLTPRHQKELASKIWVHDVGNDLSETIIYTEDSKIHSKKIQKLPKDEAKKKSQKDKKTRGKNTRIQFLQENHSTPETAVSTPTPISIQSSPQDGIKRKEKGSSKAGKKDSEKEEKVLTPKEKCLAEQSKNKYQTLPMAFSKIKIDPEKLKNFKDKHPQFNGVEFKDELRATAQSLDFQLEMHKKIAETKVQNRQGEMKKEIIQNSLRFEYFDKFKKDISPEFDEEFFYDYLTYEIYTRLLQIQCQEVRVDSEKIQINPEAIEKYLEDGITGAKVGVPGHQVKIRTKAGVRKLLHPEDSDSKELKILKAGARLAFDIFFKTGLYERLIMKHIQTCTKENTKTHAHDILTFFTANKLKYYEEFLSSDKEKKNNPCCSYQIDKASL